MTVKTHQLLRLTHRFHASPERVFDAWINPEIACKWLLTTSTSEANTTEMDVRIGGKWAIFDRRDGVDYKALGEYLEIDRPHRLVFTFGMPQFSAESCRVTVEMVADGTGCLLTLTHENLPWASNDQVETGWNKMFDRLEALEQNNSHGLVTEPRTVRIERLLPGPIERVWAYLTESGKRAQWLAAGEMEPRAGGTLPLRFHHDSLSKKPAPLPEGFELCCEEGEVRQHTVTQIDPPRLLGLTWGGGTEEEPSEVTFELTPQGDDVRLVLTHRRLADRKTMTDVAGGWHTHLAILMDRLNGREPEAFWSTFAELHRTYEHMFSAE